MKNLFTFLFSLITIYAQASVTDSLVNVLKQEDLPDTQKVRVYNLLSKEYRGDDPATALKYANQALLLSKSIEFNSGEAQSLRNAGVVYSRLGQYEKASGYLKMAVQKYREAADPKGLAGSLNSLGVCYDLWGNYDKALNCYLQSLALYERLNNLTGMSQAYNNIGLVYDNQGEYEKALLYYFKDLDLIEKMNDTLGMGQTFNNIGIIYKKQGLNEKALEYLTKSLSIKKEFDDREGIASALLNVAVTEAALKKYKAAMPRLQEALRIYIDLDDKKAVCQVYNSRGMILQEQNNFSESLINYKKALEIATSLGSLPEYVNTYSHLSDLYAEIKNYEEAYRYQSLMVKMKDSLFNVNSNKQIAEMQAKYDSDKKEKEIELLNTNREVQEARLKKQDIIRNFLLGFALLIIIVVLIVWKAYKNKKRAHDELSKLNMEISSQKEQITNKNVELERQKVLVEEKNKAITDSIYYAKRIQDALLTSDKFLNKHLAEHFVLNLPKDIISGDFYWSMFLEKEQRLLLATADCTGHGVPGALMSVIGISFLNEIVVMRGMTECASILNRLRDDIVMALNPDGKEAESKDGMDIVLCSFDFRGMQLDYAAGYNNFYVIRKNECIELKADKIPVGKQVDELKMFNHKTFKLERGDVVYTFSDGYADQFGGPNGKKFKYKPFSELLVSISGLPMNDQKKVLDKTIQEWKGNLEQVDDILVLGVRV